MSETESFQVELSLESYGKDYDSVLSQIEKELEGGNLESFISERLGGLFVGKSSKEISLMFNPLHEGVIHSESEIKRVQFLDGFKVDDNSIYLQLLETIKDLKKAPSWESKTKIVNYSPAVYKISEQQYNDIKSGGTLEVNHNDYVATENSEISSLPSKRVYGGPTIMNKL